MRELITNYKFWIAISIMFLFMAGFAIFQYSSIDSKYQELYKENEGYTKKLDALNDELNNDEQQRTIEELKEQVKVLESQVDSSKNDEISKIKKTVDKYCETYMTYDAEKDTIDDRIEKAKPYLSDSYYNHIIDERKKHGGETGFAEDYKVSTSVSDIYYKDFTDTSITVFAFFDVSSKSDGDTIKVRYPYEFIIKYNTRDNLWQIDSLEQISLG